LKSGKRKVELSKLPVFDAIDEAVGRAAEMGRPVHYTFGNTDIDLGVLASFKILDYVAQKCAQMDVTPIVTLTRPQEQPMVEEILKSAWGKAGKAERYRPDFVRFLTQSFPYITGVLAILAAERPAASFVIGSFFNEALLIPAAGRREGAFQVGGTATVVQLAFLVATCDYTLIGEEMFIAGAYLSGAPFELASAAIQDVGKVVAIAICVLGCILKLVGSNIVVRILSY
jgi:hypothetical protein